MCMRRTREAAKSKPAKGCVWDGHERLQRVRDGCGDTRFFFDGRRIPSTDRRRNTVLLTYKGFLWVRTRPKLCRRGAFLTYEKRPPVFWPTTVFWPSRPQAVLLVEIITSRLPVRCYGYIKCSTYVFRKQLNTVIECKWPMKTRVLPWSIEFLAVAY
jgi:hypothetical protein